MKLHPLLSHIAPGLLGALFLSLSGCDKKGGPDWEGHSAAPAAKETPPPARTEPPPQAAPAAVPAPPETETVSALPDGVRFVAYNVQNWLTMDRQVDGRSQKGSPKPEKERNAVISLIRSQEPDVIGLCEIGAESDVSEIQTMLEAAGHPMPHFHISGGGDTVRRLALISKHPIVSTKTRDNLDYRLNGKEYAMQRGILDATVDTPAGTLRFLGVHLKSKRETDEGDQEQMRRNEAHLLRREIDVILRDDPQAPLVVYGDMNDYRQSSTVRTIHGSGNNNPRSLIMVALKDSRGEYWTHHWTYQDVYSRLDYVFLGRSLRDKISWDDSRIIDDPGWRDASDHRPLLIVFNR